MPNKTKDELASDDAFETEKLMICKQCWTSVRKNEIGPAMIENAMGVDELPNELKELNPFEEFLVRRAHAFYSVVKLSTYSKKANKYKGNLVTALKGTGVNLRMPTAETSQHVLHTMPMDKPEENLRIYAHSLPNKQNIIWKNLADMKKVLQALEWLKKNNPVYGNITIDKKAFDNYDSSDLIHLLKDDPEKETEEEIPPLKHMLTETLESHMENEYSMQETDDARVAAGDHLKTYQQVKVQSEPMHYNKEKLLDLMMHPLIYPKGNGGSNDPKRQKKLRLREFFMYRLMNKDPRFRRNLRFLHTSYMNKRENSFRSGLYAMLNTGSKLKNMTAGQIKNRVMTNDEQAEKELYMAFQTIKGTKEYWQRQNGDLRAMCEAWGPMTFFVTLSCAEYKWPELHDYLRKKNADLENIETMTSDDLIKKDPVSVSEFFMRRFEGLMKNMILQKNGPLGTIEHYWWRLEYQARGAPHIHMVLWAKDAPVLGENDEKEVMEYISKYITAEIPHAYDNDHLRNLVKTFQIHKCSGSCKRFVSQKTGKTFSGPLRCRYGFPKELSKTYEMNSFDDSVKSRKNRKQKVRNL